MHIWNKNVLDEHSDDWIYIQQRQHEPVFCITTFLRHGYSNDRPSMAGFSDDLNLNDTNN